MKIRIKYIHNKQAIAVKGRANWNLWSTFFQNQQRFSYENDRLNKLKMVEPSQEQIEGSRGDY